MSQTITARQMVPELATEIDAPDSVQRSAEILADQFGGVDPEYPPPENDAQTLAVACLYIANTMHEHGWSKKHVCETLGRSRAVVAQAVTHIASELAQGETA